MSDKFLLALKHIQLESNNLDLIKACQQLSDAINNNTIQLEDAIRKLSEFLLHFEDTVLFRNYFSDILLALVTITIPLKPVFSNKEYDLCTDLEKTKHLEYSIVLGLLSDHPDIIQYALKYFQINPIPPYDVFIHHEDAYNVAPKKRRLLDCRQKITDYHMVLCCHSLLTKLPKQLSAKWDWTSFIVNFSQHENYEIRQMVKECIAILSNMTEAQSKLLSKNLKIADISPNIPKNIHYKFHNGVNEDLIPQIANVVNIDGIMLPIYDESNVQGGNLVPVKSTMNNLRSLALAVASGNSLSLMGPVGSGKTSLVEHLAAITGRKGVAFKKVQLGDQTDSRMLLGSHQCTDIPGEFIWAPGVLTEAVRNGHWLLLEDIDSAALDVASTLSSLLERKTLCVPGYRDALAVTPGFQLFVTQRTVITNYGFQKKLSNSSTLLQKHLTQINVEPLSRSEMAEIIQIKYPSLTTISPRMIEVFMMFSVGSHDTSLQNLDSSDKDTNLIIKRGSRLISTRDLMKWCARSVVGFDVTSPESALKVLQDAFDIFTSSISSMDDRLDLAKKVGTCLGIVETKTEFYFKHYKPNVSLHPNSLEVGRASVPRLYKSLERIDFENRDVVFSFTRQSAGLLEKIACCVTASEPVLLVGETGTGKTSSVQYLAKQTGHKLVVINMNQQSDSADLLGGYKPVHLKYIVQPIKNDFIDMFKSFYNVEKNQKFLGHIETCYDTENWTALVALMKQSHKSAVSRLQNEKQQEKLKTWMSFGYKLLKLEQQVKAELKLTFAFIEGSLIKAMQEGYWVLLDEINLASAEVLECLAGLLEDKDETIELLEKGDKVPVKRHPDFTLFACMNPATDVGKKDLPVGLRNRFTEFFVDELTERNDLMLLIGDYLSHMNLSGAVLEAIYNFYSSVKKEAKLNLVDGAGNAPHYSLRTLCRALMAAAKAKCGTVSRSLYEAFCLSFLTQLDRMSHPKVEAMIAKAVIGKKSISSVLKQIIPEPKSLDQNCLLFEGHWIAKGNLDINIPDDYILTPTVRKNLRDIARIVSLSRLPILLQGDTSVGKTSLITYMAKASGNYCVRINNHEHTDLQEYIGSYATDSSGSLVFKEGVLVEAMRKGYWIILDELNLAPSDVLEALNRVLDDNRELYIPETQETVKADPNFMLFATQNPPGLYGGRKMLSRAFRNRFVELHFDEIPRKELETILHQRCHIPASYSKKMIEVMAELQVRRRGSAAVQGKDGFITLRDLFRWGQRYKLASNTLTEKFYDWDQHIADEGYLILAGKVRQADEREIIVEVVEKHIKRKVIPENLFSLHQNTSSVTKSILELILNNQLKEFSHIVWTYNMRRLAVLIAKAFSFDEPVLLVGETGCGKTTICQVLAKLSHRQLLSLNCHMHTDSSDFLGGLRPVRQYKNDGRLFEWVDGPLIKAMEKGDLFLADEISLADDSVLERMNSLLEPERQLVLSERSSEESKDVLVITANKNFHFIGTMNPGGDFGKKELSPALRNRFTEIWCDHVSSRHDLVKVLEKSVIKGISLGNQEDGSSGIGNSILDFTDWLKNSEVTSKFPFSIRDLLSWVEFINITVTKSLLDVPEAYIQGACMTFLDCFGTTLTGHIDAQTLILLRQNAIDYLFDQIKNVGNENTEHLRDVLCNKQLRLKTESNATKFGIKPFYIDIGPYNNGEEKNFSFTAPTTGSNTLRLLRGLQLNKAILLEGNPGVGKTSLVTALAKTSGHRVIRINLSDQTDITDLFGTDLPTEDGSFAFKEGAFLNALQNGDWILLDELNLAPQPVLEGLNACLDHRGEIFIPELGKTFKVKKQTKLFACQNPLKQGGARRGLPVSFLNRFTQVYIDTLTKNDLLYIVEAHYSQIPTDILHRIVEFNCRVSKEITELQHWGHKGGPWEMNLRDIQRWCEAMIEDKENGSDPSPGKFIDMLYVNRMRSEEDKDKMIWTYNQVFGSEYPRSDDNPQFVINDDEIIFGDVKIRRNNERMFSNKYAIESDLLLLRNQMPILKAIAQNVKMNWLSILVGPTATGKSSVVQVIADLTGNDLRIVPVTSTMDVSDLLGGFEQVDFNRNLENLYDKIEIITIETTRKMWLKEAPNKWKLNRLMSNIYQYRNIEVNEKDNNEIEKYKTKLNYLIQHCENLLEFNGLYAYRIEDTKNIIIRLRHLKEKISKLSSVNGGGKFEWIDSLLVKTMEEGSWLLLDNVNLTSAAVLDRLNGLLEPNGVLSIPERGDISEIKPHPNFRIFFTMDPKYGEISRAMRNRGVEMYILRSEDTDLGLSETMEYFDLIALLSSCGLPSQYHDICIRCHESMTVFIQGLERPTISHLLQAAHLTYQQLVRGISSKTALLNSFSDVYIKPRSGSDFTSNINKSLAEMKNAMLIELQNELEEDYNDIEDITGHTLTVKGLNIHSENETAKQIAYPILKLNLDASTIDKELHSVFNIIIAFKKCPPNCKETLYYILKQNMDANKGLLHGLIENTFEHLNSEPDYVSFQRYCPETFKLNENAIAKSNINVALLYNELLKKLLQNSVTTSGFSAIDYSKAVTSGKITDDFVEYPILKYCQTYLQVIDNYIVNTIKSCENNFDDNVLGHVIQLLNWRSRFIKMCSRPIFITSKNKRTPILKEDIVPLLQVHSKWIQKYLLEQLFKLQPNKKLQNLFQSEVNKMNLNTDQSDTMLMKVTKKLRTLYGQPKLYRNQREYDSCNLRRSVNKNTHLDMNLPIDKQIYKVSVDPISFCTEELAVDVPGEQINTLNTNVLELIEKSKDNKLQTKIKLLPYNLYVMKRVIQLIQPHLIDLVGKLRDNGIKTNVSCTEVLMNLVNFGKESKGFPPALLSQLEIMEQIMDSRDEMLIQNTSSLAATFWDQFYKLLESSPDLYPLSFFNFNNLVTCDDGLEPIPVNNKRVSSNLPLMTFYVDKMITFMDEDKSSRIQLSYNKVALRDRAEYSAQLRAIQNVLWKNIASLDVAAAYKLKSDATFELQKYEQLLGYLYACVSTQKEIEIDKLQDKVLIELKKYFDESVIIELVTKANIKYENLVDEMNRIHESTAKLKIKILSAQLSLLTSVILLRIMAEINPIDHVEKYRLKIEYIEEDIKMFNVFLSTYYVYGIVSGTVSEQRNIENSLQVSTDYYKEGAENRQRLIKVHPHCPVVMERINQTALKVHKYASGNTFRPKDITYATFVKDCRHFTNSVLSNKTLTTMITNLVSTCEQLQTDIKTKTGKSINHALTITKESMSWLHSVRAFYTKIDTTYSEAFPDLAKPLQSSLSQIIYSVANVTDVIRELIAKIEQGPQLQEVAVNLLEYPNSIRTEEKHLNRFVTTNFMQLLNRNVIAGNDDMLKAELECLEVLKMNLSELSMVCCARERADAACVRAVTTTLSALVRAWEKQRQEIEKQKQDEEALYVTKSKCEDEDDEKIAYDEIMEMFPSYSEDDFSDFKPPSLEQTVVKKPGEKAKYLISQDDVTLIYKWHSNFVKNMTNADWLSSPKKMVNNDVKSPLLLRYPTFSRVMRHAWDATDAEFEGVVSPALLVLLSHVKESIDGETTHIKPDFYRSAWVSETRECLPLLQKVKDNTNELLDQWPDFPTLKDIILIVDRIFSFPITSPVSRFLTGLELLRDKLEEWNKNAHKGNNMVDISLEVGQQIVNWRRLEVTHWKECLNSLYQRKQSEAHKYWFYLFGVVTSYLDGTGDASSARVISVLKDFMETSNVAEFEVRLDIVYVYHCHLVHLEAGEKRDELISILWNTHNYYAQFLPQVTAHIKERRAPIEKRLRDFVKICTWDRDLSYWSVKSTVEKVHKALHKHTKEFEKILKESVASQLVAPGGGADHAGLWDRPRRAAAAAGGSYYIDALVHLTHARALKKYLDVADQPCLAIPEGSLLSKVPALLNKARGLCKDTIANTGYPSLVQTLDDFVTLVIETTTHLGSLEVDSTAPKDKQTSQAKSFVQQKRKALADLFKLLARMGLNYRTGLVILSAEDQLYDFVIPPVDIEAAISYLKSRRCDASMSQLWSGCERYYQLNVARHRGFTAALTSPHKDLGVQNIERCKGFAAQLMKLTNVQKKSISKYSRHLCDLRSIVTSITNALDLDSSCTSICTVKAKLHILADCYAQASILLDQLTVVLKSLPEKTLSITCEPEFDAVLSNSPISNCFKNSDEWQGLYGQVKAIISIVDKQKMVLNKLINSVPNQIGKVVETPIVSQNYIDVTNEAATKLKIVIEKSENILSAYEFGLKNDICDIAPQHPILRSVKSLVDHLNVTIKEIEKLDEPLDESIEGEEITTIVNQTEDLVASMLLIIQSVYKKHLPIDKSADNMDVLNAIDEIIDGVKEKEESKEILEERHLKEMQDKLSSDSKMLQIDSLISKIRSLLVNYVQYIATRRDVEEARRVVMRLVPILEQTVLFVQYFISQKVAVHRVSCKMLSVLLKIFSDLAANGFCKPSDLDMEEGEGEGGPGKLTGGTGLGDGEGQKDVSDRIENQDQLDDAQRPGEEKEKEEDRDCKEEEKGVNMTDDFESHLQDVEKKEGDDSDQDNDEEDADKQMGETDNAAEKLDQQIWGSEDEEDIDEEQSKKEKEERGAGESTGQKEMAAKEQEKGTDDGADGKEKKKKKDINEMEEPAVDDDHIDPYHGNQPQLPEPEEFELPDDMNVDGEEGDEDKEGETETENPFDIDVMKQNMPEEGEESEEKKEENKNGLEVSSDEEEGEENKERQDNENAESQDGPDEEKPKDEDQNEDAKDENEEADVEEEQPDETNAKDDTKPDEQPDEAKDEENLPKNDDRINQEDKVEDNNEPNPQANPSNDDPTAEDQTENAEMERGTNDNVQTNAEQAKDEEAAPFEQTQEQVGDERQSTGRSEMDKSERGHRGDKQAARAEAQERQKRLENRPGRTDQERTLGDINEKKHKKAHSMEKQDEGTDDGGGREEEAEADAYQHVKEAGSDDVQMVDAATKEQADQQPTLQQEEEEGEEMKDDEQVAMDVDEDIQVEKAEELKPEKIKDGKENDENKSGKNKEGGDEVTGETGIEVEGDAVVTERVARGRDTTYHTRLEENKEHADELSLEQYISARNAMSSVGVTVGGADAAGAWRTAWRGAGPAARTLCERLRLVLEPTARSRMAGDFRTGRAINMRRVIPYIASHFRKDRIWLRRTKPARRDYKIAIAVDDSGSMADNRSKELAFESLALVSQALNLLESGDLAVLSFGENPVVLHPFTEQFSEHSGSKILEQLRFEQTKTKIAQLLDFCTVMFDQQSSRSDAVNAKLLVVVSDGRGIFSEGETRVLQAVRRARQQGIFIVYVIIDNPDNKDSIMDIRRPLMDPVSGSLTGFVSYLDTFPFPFYLVLRDVGALPAVLGDALRQWFELAANTGA